MTLSDLKVMYLSPSALSAWRESPVLYLLRYGFGFRDDPTPQMTVGAAVEYGLRTYKAKPDFDAALAAAHKVFDLEAGAGPAAVSEREIIRPMLEKATEASAEWKPIVRTQTRIEMRMSGLDVPIQGYLDFDAGDGFYELKTTRRMPTAIRPSHECQMAIYNAARGHSGEIVYVTDKKHATYTIGSNRQAEVLTELHHDALALQRFLGHFDRVEDALLALPVQRDNYRWSEKASEFLNRIKEGATHYE